MNSLEQDKDNLWIVLPARQGSVGFPNKNRLLFEYTALTIPESLRHRTIVTTDDEILKRISQKLGFIVVDRPEELATSEANIRDTLLHSVDECGIKDDDDVIMLYLTFPERDFSIIDKIYSHYKKHNLKSLLCKTEPKTHPFLCFYELENNKGKQVVPHNLYRRQDYPVCFNVLHYVCIFKSNEISKLNKNLYNEDTFFYPIKKTVDIDYAEDFNAWNSNK